MAKRISQLTALTSASLDTTLLGIDGGTSYKIELDVLADAVKDRINTLDDIRLDSLENFTASYTASTIPNGTISGSSQLTSSLDIRYTLSGSIANVNTSSLLNRLNAIESISGSWITESETGSFLTSLSGAISSSSQLTSSFDIRYIVSGSAATSVEYFSIGYTGSNVTVPISGNPYIPNGISQGNVAYNYSTGKFTLSANKTYILRGITNVIEPNNDNLFHADSIWFNETTNNEIGFQSSFKNRAGNTNDGQIQPIAEAIITTTSPTVVYLSSKDAYENGGLRCVLQKESSYITIQELGVGSLISGSVGAAIAGTISGSAQITAFGFVSGSYLTSLSGAISSSSQLTSSFDIRYTLSASFVSSSNVSSIQTITSASYAALTPISGTLYIIIG